MYAPENSNAVEIKTKQKQSRDPNQRSESTDRISIDASDRNEEVCKPFDELAVTWIGPVSVVVELPPCIGTLVSPPADFVVETGSVPLTPPGTVFVLAGAWLVTGMVNVGVGAVAVATTTLGVVVATTTLCVALSGVTVCVLVLAALLPISGCAD